MIGNNPDIKTMVRKKSDYDNKLYDLKQSNSKLIHTAGNNSKVLCHIVKERKNKKRYPDDLRISVGEYKRNPSIIAGHINKFFTVIADKTLKQNKDHITPYVRKKRKKKVHTPYIYN